MEAQIQLAKHGRIGKNTTGSKQKTGDKMTTQINQEMIELHEAGNAWLLAYKEAKQKIKEWSEKADIAQEQIKSMLGDAEIGLINGKESVRWTTVESRRLDVKKAREVLPPQVIDLIEIIQSTRRFTVIEEE